MSTELAVHPQAGRSHAELASKPCQVEGLSWGKLNDMNLNQSETILDLIHPSYCNNINAKSFRGMP
jgi:hypothetical protein